MKYSKKFILISILTLIILPLFLIPRTAVAQEWTYNGVDTEKIPNYSVYPSEWYVANTTTATGAVYYWAPENYTIFEIMKGNITDKFTPFNTTFPMNGTSVYANVWVVNATSGEKSLDPRMTSEFQLCWYNASWEIFPYIATFTPIIPVDDNGKVSAQILQMVSSFIGWSLYHDGFPFENNATYPNIYSFRYWNSTDYFMANFTDDGIMKKLEHTCLGLRSPNITLMSQPAQLPPDFDLKAEDGTLTVNSTEFKLKINITDADNNNDGDVDTDYLYRIQNGTKWTDWATPPDLLDWDLGDVKAGSYNITMEIKNMYDVTQKEVTIEYVPPKKPGPKIIPGYDLLLIALLTIIISAIIVRKRFKKL